MTIAEYIRTIPEWASRDWAALKVVLLKEFRDDDDHQRMRTHGHKPTRWGSQYGLILAVSRNKEALKAWAGDE